MLELATWEPGVLSSYLPDNAFRNRIGGDAGRDYDDDDADGGADDDYGVSLELNTCGRFPSASCYLNRDKVGYSRSYSIFGCLLRTCVGVGVGEFV